MSGGAQGGLKQRRSMQVGRPLPTTCVARRHISDHSLPAAVPSKQFMGWRTTHAAHTTRSAQQAPSPVMARATDILLGSAPRQSQRSMRMSKASTLSTTTFVLLVSLRVELGELTVVSLLVPPNMYTRSWGGRGA